MRDDLEALMERVQAIMGVDYGIDEDAPEFDAKWAIVDRYTGREGLYALCRSISDLTDPND